MQDIILTHMHWDHAGNIDKFVNSKIHIQNSEMRNVTGSDMGIPELNNFFLVDDVCSLIQKLFDGSVILHDRDSTIVPGISVHEVGGHSAGMQVVRVYTQRGWVVLASDASHFYANMLEKNPFPVIYNFADTLRAYDTCLKLADSPDHVIPGHDPLVLQRYPAFSSSLSGGVVRLDVDPIK